MTITGELAQYTKYVLDTGLSENTANAYRAIVGKSITSGEYKNVGKEVLIAQLAAQKSTQNEKARVARAVHALFDFLASKGEQVNFEPAEPIEPDYDLVSRKEFATIMGSSSANLFLQLEAHPKAPKPIARFNGQDAWRRTDAVNFKSLIEQEKAGRKAKAEAAQQAEDASLRAAAQAKQKENQEVNVLRMKLEAAEKTAFSNGQLAAQRLIDREAIDKENQRLTVAVNENSKAIADLSSQIRDLEAIKRKCLSFMGWLSTISGTSPTAEFDKMKANIQACLEKAQTPDVEKLVATYKTAAELAERNYQRISDEHLKLMDEHKVAKQNLAWFDILVEHTSNFIEVSRGIKSHIWTAERAAIFRTLHIMGKLK